MRLKTIFKVGQNKGFSLVEVVVAMGVLGMATYGFLNFTDILDKATTKVSSIATVSRVLLKIQNEILRDSIYYPPLPITVFNEESDDPVVFFNKKEYIANRCYDKTGTLVKEKVEKCYITVSFYKTSVKDVSTLGKGPADLPVSRVYFKLKYHDGNNERVKIFSRLVTNVISY